jgi:hypothetical protein
VLTTGVREATDRFPPQMQFADIEMVHDGDAGPVADVRAGPQY